MSGKRTIELLERIHRDREQVDFKTIWEKGLFVFDSNVILDLYRLPVSARDDLIRIFQDDNFKRRIWIPFQVILEFLNNRFTAISDQKSKFHSSRNVVEEAISQYNDLFQQLESKLNKLKLKQRHSLIDPSKFINLENKNQGIQFLLDFKNNLDELETKQADINDHDEIKDIVMSTFKGRIGASFDKNRLEEIYKEGDERYNENIPPGYKDKDKKESYHLVDKKFKNKFGDLILWKEIIEKVKTDKIRYLVLVSGDVKEDWWFEKKGKKLGPRLELLNEIYTEAPELDTFYMYNTSTFLKYAKKELKFQINDTSITLAEELIELSRQVRAEEESAHIHPVILNKYDECFPVSNIQKKIETYFKTHKHSQDILNLPSEEVYESYFEKFFKTLIKENPTIYISPFDVDYLHHLFKIYFKAFLEILRNGNHSYR